MGRTVREALETGAPSFSFEFFPPKTDEGEAQLWRAIRELEPLAPTFVSVTYGAGGTTRDRTVRIVQRIARETSLLPVAHLTCVAASRDEVRATIRQIADAGIRNVLALRGDMPGDPTAPFAPHSDGLRHADELVRMLHEEGDFCVGVAAFPEGHPEAPDKDTDVKYLAQKCAAGANFAVTQFFFHAEDYFDLLQRARRAGCHVPIIPGVMPVTNVRQIEKFAQLSGAEFPPDLARRFHAAEHDPDAVRRIGVEVAHELCTALLAGGAPGIHFYTLNRSTSTREIFERLGAT
jgi:methylenetetrahydrofolate reductase (NADPH)